MKQPLRDLTIPLKLLARITPILDVSKECQRESTYYLKNLILNDEHPLWAIKSKVQYFDSKPVQIY